MIDLPLHDCYNAYKFLLSTEEKERWIMRTPFPGMDPYLEHPALWPDVHNSLIASIRDVLVPKVAPRYYIALERRTYLLDPDDLVFIGRPDITVVTPAHLQPKPSPHGVAEATAVYEVDVPMADEVGESYLEIHEAKTGVAVTVMELLSPTNKVSEEGRRQYVKKRTDILRSRTSLVEIDLLRAGRPMAVIGPEIQSDYRILTAPGWLRPHARLHAFGVRQPIPELSVPLRRGEEEPTLPLNDVLHDLYTRARFDLHLDYGQPPVPPLSEEDAAWGREILANRS